MKHSDKQIFIIGTGRSGTTILNQILGSHSGIFVYHEIRFLSDISGLNDLRNHLTKDWNFHNASQAIQNFRNFLIRELFDYGWFDKYLTLFYRKVLRGSGKRYWFSNIKKVIPKAHLEACLNRFIQDITIDTFKGSWIGSKSYRLNPVIYATRRLGEEEFDQHALKFLDHLLSYPLNDRDLRCWCDDTPVNITCADVLTRITTNPRIIHIYRNPLDVTASYTRQRWAPTSAKHSAIWVRDLMVKWFEIRDKIAPDQLIEIRYEEFVQNQSDITKKIMEFIGLPFENSLLDIRLNKDSIGRYKKDIPTSQLSAINEILSPVLKEYKY